MLKSLALAGALLCLFSIGAEARQRAAPAHASCIPTSDVMRPCAYQPDFLAGVRSIRVTMKRERAAVRVRKGASEAPKAASRAAEAPSSIAGLSPVIVAHPTGCPVRAFCGCGAAVRVFGHSIRNLWLAANWFKFPRAAPSAGMVAVKKHHVFVLEQHLGGDTWLAYDANSGRHLTRLHARSIAGFAIVNPRAG
jgi:hypothetical protein